MTQLDGHGRLIMPDYTSTAVPRLPYATDYLCAHGWITFEKKPDGYGHKICALCGADLGLWNYFVTNTPPKLGDE